MPQRVAVVCCCFLVVCPPTASADPAKLTAIHRLARQQPADWSAITCNYWWHTGQSLSNPYTGILSIFSNLIMSGKPINIFEDGRESRDFVYIDDVVASTEQALFNPAAANEVFNVGSGTPVDVMKVARTLVRLLGTEVPVAVSGNYRIGDIRHNYACLQKAKHLLGFTPQFDFEAGIRLFCDWVKTQGPVHSDYEGSIAEMKQKGLLK